MADQNNAPEQATDQVALLTAQNDALAGELAKMEERVKALESAPRATSVVLAEDTPKLPKECPEFTVSGQKYRFTVPTFYLDTTLHTAVDAVKDKPLLAKIVSDFSGIVEKL